jgi:hypothetical protein
MLLAGGCGKPMPTAEPPRLKAELVRDLFTAFGQRDYEQAAPKVARLRELHPESVYLAELAGAIRNNRIAVAAQERLDADDLDGAAAVVGEAIREHGRHEAMMAMQARLAELQDLKALVDTCVQPTGGVALARAAARLRTLASGDARLAPFLPMAEAQLRQARELQAWERRRAIDDLCSDIDGMLDNGDRDAFVLLAVLAAAEPGHRTLDAWQDFLAGTASALPRTYATTSTTKKSTP